MDRGWRKCQNYYYKPNLISSICPCKWYTIRMDVTQHEIRKSHKKTWNRWLKFLSGDESQLTKDTKMTEEKLKVVDTSKFDEWYQNCILKGLKKYVKNREISFLEYLKIDEKEAKKLYSAIKIIKTKDINKSTSGDFICNLILCYYGMFKKTHKMEMKEFTQGMIQYLFDSEHLNHHFTIHCEENNAKFNCYINATNYLCFF